MQSAAHCQWQSVVRPRLPIRTENFFGILKQEMYYGTTYYSFEELKDAIERYIKYYNEKRIKEKLGWMSPVEYRLNTLAA